MKSKENIGMVGHVTLTHEDEEGNVKEVREFNNLVVDDGLAGAASRLAGAGSEAVFTYIGIGTGTTAAASGDTALETEVDYTNTSEGARTADGSPTRETTTVTNDTAVLDVTYNFTGSRAITESGLLNAATGGTLLARQTFSAINVANGDALTVTWKITFA